MDMWAGYTIISSKLVNFSCLSSGFGINDHKKIWFKALKVQIKREKEKMHTSKRMSFFFFFGPSKDALLYVYICFLSKPTPIPLESSSVEIGYMGKNYF